MAAVSSELPEKVFKRTNCKMEGEFSLDGQMLGALMELDGKKTIGAIADGMGLDMNAMHGLVSRLLEIKLIEPVGATVAMVNGGFFEYLRHQLSTAVGPIAAILIEDGVGDIGHTLSRFPRKHAAELVELLSRDIQREEKRNLFKKNMLKYINENVLTRKRND
jgi:hypothetical protein